MIENIFIGARTQMKTWMQGKINKDAFPKFVGSEDRLFVIDDAKESDESKQERPVRSNSEKLQKTYIRSNFEKLQKAYPDRIIVESDISVLTEKIKNIIEENTFQPNIFVLGKRMPKRYLKTLRTVCDPKERNRLQAKTESEPSKPDEKDIRTAASTGGLDALDSRAESKPQDSIQVQSPAGDAEKSVNNVTSYFEEIFKDPQQTVPAVKDKQNGTSAVPDKSRKEKTKKEDTSEQNMDGDIQKDADKKQGKSAQELMQQKRLKEEEEEKRKSDIIRDAERAIFKKKKPKSRFSLAYSPLDASKTKTTELVLSRTIDDINANSYEMREYSNAGEITTDDYVDFIMVLIKSEGAEDFKDSWNVQSSHKLSYIIPKRIKIVKIDDIQIVSAIENDSYEKIKQSALYYLSVCTTLFGEDPRA